MSADLEPGTAARRVADIADLLGEYQRRYEAAHDARAVFTYTYRLLTAELARGLAADAEFHDPEWIADLAAAFGARYVVAMDGIDEWERYYPYATSPDTLYASVPRPWVDAYWAICHEPSTVLEDLAFPMAAHITSDLPYALLEVGTDTDRLSDYHRMNDVLASNTDTIQRVVTARYDPLFGRLDELAGDSDELFTDYWVRVGRSMAWYNAMRLQSPRSRTEAKRSIDRTTAALVRSVRADMPWPFRVKARVLRRALEVTRRWPDD